MIQYILREKYYVDNRNSFSLNHDIVSVVRIVHSGRMLAYHKITNPLYNELCKTDIFIRSSFLRNIQLASVGGGIHPQYMQRINDHDNH